MKSIFSDLVFDRELVSNLKKAQVSKQQLYNQLINGRITLKEYLSLL